jgi:hypothetical protein
LEKVVQSIEVGLGARRLKQTSRGHVALESGWGISARAAILHMQYSAIKKNILYGIMKIKKLY